MKSPTKSKATDAISLLTEDHKKVLNLFEDFEKLGDEDDSDSKGELVRQICTELTVHAQIEEEIFYPAVRDAIAEGDLLDEAEVEHATAKDLIAQLESMQPGDELYDAKVTVLGEYINHHVKEEQGEMFPKVKKADLDLVALGEELQQRKDELMDELEEEDDAPTGGAGRGKAGAKASRSAGVPARH